MARSIQITRNLLDELFPPEATEQHGFEVRDVESLREHYAMTLRHWVRWLEADHPRALDHVSEPTYRVWRLFMSGSAHGFSVARLNLHQSLLTKPDGQGRSWLPLTCTDIYAKRRSRDQAEQKRIDVTSSSPVRPS